MMHLPRWCGDWHRCAAGWSACTCCFQRRPSCQQNGPCRVVSDAAGDDFRAEHASPRYAWIMSVCICLTPRVTCVLLCGATTMCSPADLLSCIPCASRVCWAESCVHELCIHPTVLHCCQPLQQVHRLDLACSATKHPEQSRELYHLLPCTALCRLPSRAGLGCVTVDPGAALLTWAQP